MNKCNSCNEEILYDYYMIQDWYMLDGEFVHNNSECMEDFVLSNSIHMDKNYIDEFVDTDFYIADIYDTYCDESIIEEGFIIDCDLLYDFISWFFNIHGEYNK